MNRAKIIELERAARSAKARGQGEPDPRPKSKARSRQRAAGAYHEGIVNAHIEVLRRAGAAFVVRQHPEVDVVGRRGRSLHARVIGKGTVDYMGGLPPSGRLVAFDVKSSSTPRLPLVSSGKATLRPHQRRDLLTVDELGGVAGVLVAMAPRDQAATMHRLWFWLPVRVWVDGVADLLQAGRKSMSVEWMAEHAIPVGEGRRLDLPAAWAAHDRGGER